MTRARRKNHTGPNRQLARTKTRHAPRHRSPWEQPPPLQAYRDIIGVPAAAKDWPEHPATAAQVGAEAKDMVDTLVRLGPVYSGRVPFAALFLDRLIRSGKIPFGLAEDPDHCRVVTLPQVAADIAAKSGEPPVPTDQVGMLLHELHAGGWLVVDDNHVVRNAIPPSRPGGKWLILGVTPAEEWPT